MNSDYDVMWKTNMPLKIKVLLWWKNRIITKVNLVKRGWNGCTKCMFCDSEETTDRLFVQCSYVNSIWQWIPQYNNFTFYGQTIEDLWLAN